MKFVVVIVLFGAAIVAVLALLGRGKKPAPKSGAARPQPSPTPPPTAAAIREPPTVAPGASNWLVGEEGEVAGKTFLIAARTVTIGRATTNFVQLNTEEASRVQCQIRPTPGGLQLTDMKSANGTFVNGARVRQHLLKDGDVIRIGDAAMTYREKGDYGKDYGLASKAAGVAQARETRFSDAENSKSTVADALKANQGDQAAAAQQLGISIEELHGLMKQHGIAS